MKLNIKQMLLNWIGGGKTIVPVRFLKSIDVIGEVPEQVQSDWNQTDNTKPDYIKNKPNISNNNFIIYDIVDIDNNNNKISVDTSLVTICEQIRNGKNVFLIYDNNGELHSDYDYARIVSFHYESGYEYDGDVYQPIANRVYAVYGNKIMEVVEED